VHSHMTHDLSRGIVWLPLAPRDAPYFGCNLGTKHRTVSIVYNQSISMLPWRRHATGAATAASCRAPGTKNSALHVLLTHINQHSSHLLCFCRPPRPPLQEASPFRGRSSGSLTPGQTSPCSTRASAPSTPPGEPQLDRQTGRRTDQPVIDQSVRTIDSTW
jgi:hypothetical protein